MHNFAIRFFGSEECDKCKSLKKAFEFHGLGYDYIDVEDPSNDKLCDERQVDELPHLEAYFTKINKVFFKHVGYINPIQFLEKSIEKSDELDKFFAANVNSAKNNVDMQDIEKMMTEGKQTGCNSCKKNKNAQ